MGNIEVKIGANRINVYKQMELNSARAQFKRLPSHTRNKMRREPLFVHPTSRNFTAKIDKMDKLVVQWREYELDGKRSDNRTTLCELLDKEPGEHEIYQPKGGYWIGLSKMQYDLLYPAPVVDLPISHHSVSTHSVPPSAPPHFIPPSLPPLLPHSFSYSTPSPAVLPPDSDRPPSYSSIFPSDPFNGSESSSSSK